MRFGRKRTDGFDAPITAVDRVVRRTSVGLAVVTLVLIGALLAGVGVVTAAVALRASSDQVDRTLKQAADSRIQQLQLQAEQVELPTPTPSASPTSTSSDDDEPTARPTPSPTRTRTPRPTQTARQTVRPTRTRTPEATRTNDNSGPGNGDGTPRPARTDNSGSLSRDAAIGAFAQLRLFPTPAPASTTTARPTPSASFALPGLGDRPPESADTFFLLLNTAGDVISNPQGVSLDGLPDEAAVVTAIITGEDWRTTTVRGVRVRLLTQPVRDPDGNPVGVLQSGFVLTLQDQQTNQLLTTIALACLVGLTGAALITLFITRRAMRPIRSAFDAERRFVASASHELRTPAAVVRANAEILEREDLVKPEGKALVADIISETDRLGRLVGDMLALASAEAGAITIEEREIEMRGFVADVARRAEALADERGVKLDVVQDGPAPEDQRLIVSADPDRMTQLLLIFVDNAIDHSPAGGTVRLYVRPASDGGRQLVTVSVGDEGPGVPREERNRIFEPFARLRGRRRETGNTGLGLAVARILAARQNAILHVGDAPGGGALFSVWLPRRLPG